VRRTPRTRSIAAVAGALIGAVVLAGCGAGQITQTSDQVAAIDGANADAGPIGVRNAFFLLPENAASAVAYPRGGSAPLALVIANSGSTNDELLSVTSPIAASVEITGPRAVPAGRALVVEGEPIPSATSATPAAAPTSAPEAGTTAAPEASATPAAPTSAPVAASPSAEVLPTDAPDAAGTAKIVLSGLREDIKPGLTYEVVFTFRNAGPVRVLVPVASSQAPRTVEH